MKRTVGLFSVFLLFLPFLSGYSAAATGAALQPEAGFITIEPVTFYFHYGHHFSRLLLRSSEARLWYSFHPAEVDREGVPLFVFFNGGPGASTSFGLMSMYTGPYTLDNTQENGGDSYVPNPVSWTRLGNLLHIDARQTGYSYSLMGNAGSFEARYGEFNAQNFNPFFDAADFIRVLLRFLAQNPGIQSNPVILVGESYGGVRSTSMLHMLLNYADYGNGREMYQDEALVSEIQAHYDAVFPEYSGGIVPPDAAARQFGSQVMIQPTLSLGYQVEEGEILLRQPGGVLDQIGEEVGILYDPALHGDSFNYVYEVVRRDPFQYDEARDWLNGFFRTSTGLLRQSSQLSLLTGVDITLIQPLYADSRQYAYRLFSPYTPRGSQLSRISVSGRRLLRGMGSRQAGRALYREPGDFADLFGELEPWDWFFLPVNHDVNWAFVDNNVAVLRGFDVDYMSPRFGHMFLQNVLHVRTFITAATFDVVIYSPAIPAGLARHWEILASVRHEKQSLDQRASPDRLILTYLADAFPGVPDPGSRTLWFPSFAESGHTVSLTEPFLLFDLVSAWLSDAGISQWPERSPDE